MTCTVLFLALSLIPARFDEQSQHSVGMAVRAGEYAGSDSVEICQLPIVACGKPEQIRVDGCSYSYSDHCRIEISTELSRFDYVTTLGHEVLHCAHGSWHASAKEEKSRRQAAFLFNDRENY